MDEALKCRGEKERRILIDLNAYKKIGFELLDDQLLLLMR